MDTTQKEEDQKKEYKERKNQSIEKSKNYSILKFTTQPENL